MTPQTHILALPRPSFIHEIDETQFDQSTWTQGAIVTKLMAAGVHPKLYRLTWTSAVGVPRETADGVFLHADEYGAGKEGGRQFPLMIPWLGGVPVVVVWHSFPRYVNTSARFRSVEGIVALALANDFATVPETPDEVTFLSGEQVTFGDGQDATFALPTYG